MRNEKGQFIKGIRASPKTEFKKGTHWRKPKPYWDRAWLAQEYEVKQRGAAEIASEQGCSENNILFWLAKYSIPRRTMIETRRIKKWSLSGKRNGMFGKRGADTPNWKGGITPERQAFYSSPEWSKTVDFIWERDKATCQSCKREANGKPFHIHHRIDFSIRSIRTNLGNLVLLCPKCHRWVHSKANSQKQFIGAFQITFEGG